MTLIPCLPVSGQNIRQSAGNAGIAGISISAVEVAGSVHMPGPVIFQLKIHSVLLSRIAIRVHKIFSSAVGP
jgi:hypothetical protein